MSSLCAVVIFAVVERPGRRSSEGVVEGNDNFEVLGFLHAAGGLAGRDAGGAQEGLIADLGDVAFEDFAGQSVDGDVGFLADCGR